MPRSPSVVSVVSALGSQVANPPLQIISEPSYPYLPYRRPLCTPLMAPNPAEAGSQVSALLAPPQPAAKRGMPRPRIAAPYTVYTTMKRTHGLFMVITGDEKALPLTSVHGAFSPSPVNSRSALKDPVINIDCLLVVN